MKKLLPILLLLVAPFVGFAQEEFVINGTTNIKVVEHGGTAATPIYLVVANGLYSAFQVTGEAGYIVSENEYDYVRWVIGTHHNTVANTGYIVPFGYTSGTLNFYLPIVLGISAAGTGANNYIDFSTWHTQGDNWTGPNIGLNGKPAGVSNMHAMWPTGSPSNNDDSYNVVDRFWEIDPSSYGAVANIPTIGGAVSGANTPNGTGGTGIQLSYLDAHGLLTNVDSSEISHGADHNNVFAENTLIQQRYNTSGTWGDWTGQGAQQTTYATVTNELYNTGAVWTGTVGGAAGVTPANFFKDWTLSSSTDPLPITLASFTAQCNNGTALIQWTSESEINNSYYTVKKSTDNVHFDVIGTMKTQAPDGTSSLPLYYTMTDNTPYPGTSYYILDQTDIDGTTKQVGTYEFTGCETTPVTTVKAYNTTNYIEIQINTPEAGYFTISLTNMLGQTVIQESRGCALGENEIRLNNTVATGIYLLSVRNNGDVNYTKKLVLGVR